VSKGVAVWCIAEWARLRVVAKPVVGGPCVEPSFENGRGRARFASVSDVV